MGAETLFIAFSSYIDVVQVARATSSHPRLVWNAMPDLSFKLIMHGKYLRTERNLLSSPAIHPAHPENQATIEHPMGLWGA